MHSLPKIRWRTGAAGAWVLVAALAAPTAVATAPGDERDVALRLSATGRIVAIDAAQRLMTVEGPRGRATYRLDPQVRNLAQVRVGDQVRIDYVAAVALTLRRGGLEIREKVESEAGARAASGETPAAAYARRTTVVADVLAVDRAAHTVRLRGPQGHVHDVHVRDPADMAEVREGDRVVAVLYEAVAVGVVPAAR